MSPQDNLRRAILNDEFPDDPDMERLFTPAGEDLLKLNRNIALSAWMSQVSRSDINAGSPTWQADKDALVQGYFKNPTASNVSDEQLHSLVKTHIQTAEEAADMAANMALQGKTSFEAVKEMNAKRGPSLVRGIWDGYTKDLVQRHSALATKLAPYRGVINDAASKLGKEMENAMPYTEVFQEVAAQLLQVPEEDRGLVISAIGATGGATAEERASYLSKLAGAMGRMTETMGSAIASDVESASLAETVVSLQEAGQMDFARKMEKNIQGRQEFNLLTQQIRQVADSEVSPIKGDNWWSQTGIDVARMAPQVAVTLANPAIGTAANLSYFRATVAAEAKQEDPSLTYQQADTIGALTAPFNAAIETVTSLIPFGKVKLPFVQKWLSTTTTSVKGAARNLVVRGAFGVAAEVGEEMVQAVAPLWTQGLLGELSKDMPGVDWEKRMPDFSKIAAQTWGPALVFALVGGGAASINDIKNGRALASDLDLLIARGTAPELAAKIKEASDAGDYRKVDSLFREEFVSDVRASRPDIQAATERLKARIQAQESVEALQDTTSPEYTVNVTRSPSGWQVRTGDGSVIDVDSAEAARRIAVDLRQVASQQEADALVTVIDDYYAAGRQAETVLTGETVKAGRGGVFGVRRDASGNVIATRAFDAKALETIRQEAEVAGIKTGTADIFAHVNGSNDVFPMRVADTAKEIARRLSLYKSQAEGQPQVITFLHENIESSWRLGMANGTFSEQDTRTAFRALVPAFEGVKARTPEEGQFIENLRTLADGKGDETMLRETVSEMVVRDVLGRDRQGRATGMRPGSISRAIEAAVMGAKTQQEASAFKRILAMFRAFSAYLKGIFGTVKAIVKARDEGKIGEEWDTFVNKVLGIDEAKQMEGEAVKEAQEIMDAGNMAFSVSPVTPAQDAEYLAAVEDGDLAKAQSMVDEAAKAAGFDREAFKAMPEKDWRTDEPINVIKSTNGPWAGFFTDAKEAADRFGRIMRQPVRRAFLKLSKPFEVDASGKAAGELQFDILDDSGPYAQKNNAEILAAINSGKYDGIVLRNTTDEGTVIVPIDPNQIKSADPVTYDDQGNVIPLSQRFNPETPDIRFSISPIRNLNELSDQVERQFKENPAGALEVKSKVIRQFAKLRDKWSTERWTPKGDKIRPISEKRTAKSLDKEQAYRKRARQRELIDEGMMQLTPETLMAYSQGVATLEKDPLVSKMLNDHGRLMSKSTAEEQGKNIADLYDDAVWIPPQWYAKGAGITPDVMANNLGFDTASEMWAALDSAIKTHRSAKEGYAKAEKAVRDVEKKALEQATKEAQAWRNEADKMQQEDWSPRESLVRDLITLEAIVAMFPQEIRGKIGGFVTLARKASESARLKVLQKQLERGQVLLEKHLKDQYGEAVNDLFDKYRPERKAGEKPKGKLDPDAQEIADKAEKAMGFSADQTNAEIAAINVLLDADNISAEDEAKFEAMRELVQLMGDWKNADSARRESAFLALNDVLSEGWAKWKLKQILKREQREEMRKALKSATGKKGVGIERDKMKMEAAKVLGKAARWVLNLSSFGEVMRAVFGEKAARQFIDNERNASNQYEDAIQQFSERIDEFFTTLAGGVLRGERLRFDLAQPTLTIGAGGMNERQISQLQGIQALLMWQQEDGKRHMEGPRDENGAPIEGKWSYDQSWIDELTGKLSPEAVEVKKFIEQLYSEEWMPLNAVYRERHGVNLPRHDMYAPITVTPQQAKAGEMVDPVSGAAIAGSILTPGSLRSRNRSALAEPEFRDALSTFIAHTKQMEHWKAYYDLAVEMQSVLGNRDVANSVKAAVGDEGATVLRKWVDVFAQGGTRDAAAGLAVSDGLGRLSGRVATVGLLGRFSTLLVQSTQLAAASVKMPVGSYLKRFAMLMSGNLQWGDAINSEFIQRRIKSAPPIIRQAFQSLGEATRPNQIQRVTRFFGQLLSGADGLFTAGTYAILLDYHRAQGAKMGMEGEALESYAHAEAVNATEQVAQPVRTGARSIIEVTNTNPLAKMSWAYASEARQKMALFAWSAYNAKNDPAGAAKTAFLVFVIGGLMSQVLKNLWREAKGDDDEKKWSPERLTLSMLSPITSAIPGAAMLAGEGGSLSGAKYAQYAIKDVFDGDADMKDVDTILSVLGYFNDTAAGIATLSHAGYDFAQVLENAFGEE